MKFKKFNKLRLSLGPVEQAQIAVSTAVVVSLVTIMAVRATTAQRIEWLLFGSVLTVGLFGFIIVTITLKYGRVLEEQKQELLALNKFAQAINRSVDIHSLLRNALEEILQLIDVEYGSIYRIEQKKLTKAAELKLDVSVTSPLGNDILISDPLFEQLQVTCVKHFPKDKKAQKEREYNTIRAWATVPIYIKNEFTGIIVIASTTATELTKKQTDLITAFANQLGVAIDNANLFERLKRSEERYIDLFENSPDMTHIVNQEGIIVNCNETEAKMLGYPKEQIIGSPLFTLYPASYYEQVQKNLQRVFKEKEVLNGIEEKMMTREGALIDVSVNASLIADEDGNLTLMRAVARDITEKKKLEARIIHAQRIDSIGNLAGGIAHDFNNILTSILGSTAIMLRRLKRQKENYRLVEIIDTAAKRGASLTRQLLTFARKTTVHEKPILVSNIIKETLTLFERSIDKTIKIHTALSHQPLIIKGDDGQIQQALLNILINARDAMPNGGTITISTNIVRIKEKELTSPEQKPGEFVAISVLDTGIGIPGDVLPRIFEPFFTTKEQGRGTGLGLSVVYGVVNSHGGFVSVHSIQNKGSEFILHFPLYKTIEVTETTHKVEKLPRGNEHILVVDDENEVLEVVSRMLGELGYVVTTVNSGYKALALLRKQQHFDAVLLDLNMPRMSGQTTYMKMKKIKPEQKVIIVTGYSNRVIDTGPLRDNVEAFLQKPFQMEELAHTLRQILDRPS